ncbi:MAG TPA: RsmB/NOP family class I SAM-dependent RNA methyltransferase [Myxococcales bacterium]|nr:RsmB/NOP family class I SAM-dependent RNA methyltransferase [Myxococcales bacterium]
MDEPCLRRLRAVPWEGLAGLSGTLLPCIERVLNGAAAEREIDLLLRADRALGRPQRAAAAEAIFGVGLWRRRLAAHAGSNDPRALLFALLRDLAQVPEQRAAALAALAPPLPPPSPPPRRIAERWSYPDWIEAVFLRELGEDAEAVASAMCAPGPICLRANTLRTERSALARLLESEGVATRPGRFARDAFVVSTPRPNLLALRSYRDGLFEVQDEASQLVAQIVEARPGETVLDLCAGAGGKTLALAAAMRGRGRLFASDPDAGRLRRLADRARRAGAAVEIGQPAQADAVLADVPCSELGTLRRGPDLRFRLREEEALRFPALQREILEAALRRVRPGGRLVYATCTLRREENEEVAFELERAHPELRRLTPDLPSELLRDGFLRTWPHLHDTDGFFAAAWSSGRR